jgi:hypothetical protein
MLKYWLTDGKVLASGWVNSGPEILPKSFGEKKQKTAGCIDKTVACH